MAWVGVRTTIDRLCTGEARWELEGEIINGVSSLTSITPVTTPIHQLNSEGEEYVSLLVRDGGNYCAKEVE